MDYNFFSYLKLRLEFPLSVYMNADIAIKHISKHLDDKRNSIRNGFYFTIEKYKKNAILVHLLFSAFYRNNHGDDFIKNILISQIDNSLLFFSGVYHSLKDIKINLECIALIKENKEIFVEMYPFFELLFSYTYIRKMILNYRLNTLYESNTKLIIEGDKIISNNKIKTKFNFILHPKIWFYIMINENDEIYHPKIEFENSTEETEPIFLNLFEEYQIKAIEIKAEREEEEKRSKREREEEEKRMKAEMERRRREREEERMKREEERMKREEEERQRRLEEINNREFNCPICISCLPEQSIALNCGHVFCGGCVNGLATCPICRREIINFNQIYL